VETYDQQLRDVTQELEQERRHSEARWTCLVFC